MAVDGTTPVESEQDYGSDPAGIQKRWTAEIKLSRKEFEPWEKRCNKIVERYRDERDDDDGERRLQLIWANVQTELPALYQRPPKPEVSRRFKAKDGVARTAAAIVERYLDVDLERDNVNRLMPQIVLDRLLCSRGAAWVEYDPVIGKVPSQGDPRQQYDQVIDVRAPVAYVHWKDFLHSASPTWSDVRWVARRHKWTRDTCVKKCADGQQAMGWTPDQIPLSTDATLAPKDQEEAGDLFKRAEVWEVWDDDSGQIYFICLGMVVPLCVKPMPFQLVGKKFPCPEPLYGTLTNETLKPVPDFCEWQDLADEIDELTERIALLTEAIQVVGVRDKANDALDQMFSGDNENRLIPVDNWALFSEKGGFKGAVDWFPIDMVATVLEQLQGQRADRMNLAYQMSGIGDLLRAQGDPNMTATQANIESNFGSLRMGQKKKQLARFSEGLLRIKAQIICAMAPPEVLVMVSGIDETDDAKFAGQAIQLLKDDRLRNFKIDVDEESMAAIDDQAEKAGAIEFLGTVGPYIQQVAQAAQAMPQLLSIASESLGFVVRRMRAGRDFEGVVDQFTESMAQVAQQAQQQAQRQAAQGPPPDPKMQVEMARHANKMAEITAGSQADMQREGAQAQSEMTIEQTRGAAKAQEAAAEHSLDMQLEAFKGQQARDLAAFQAQLKARNEAMKPPPIQAGPRVH